MEKIMEHYGMGILTFIAGAASIAIYVACIMDGGIISGFVENYMNSICG